MNNKKSRVAIVGCSSYDANEVLEAVKRGIDLTGGIDKFSKPGEKLLLKPNVLFGADPERAISTHPSVFRAIARAFQEAGAILSFGDSSGFGSTSANCKRAQLLSAADELGIPLADFEQGIDMHFQDSPFIKQFTIAKGVRDADGIVSLPKMKAHNFLKMTGAVKNQFGCVPGLLKPQYHMKLQDPADFARMLVSLTLLLRPRLYAMDAVIAMEGNGPGGGDPLHVGALLFSTDPVALDAIMCRIAALDPALVPTNVAGMEQGLGTFLADEIELAGDDIDTFVKPAFAIDRIHRCGMYNLGVFNHVKNAFMQKPVIDKVKCVKCGICVSVCPVEPKVLTFRGGTKKHPPEYEYARCIRCYCCQEVCPEKAITVKTPFLAQLMLPKGNT